MAWNTVLPDTAAENDVGHIADHNAIVTALIEIRGAIDSAGIAPVTSVNGRTGAVTLTAADVGLSAVNNTSDANKPVSTLQAANLAPITHQHQVGDILNLTSGTDGKNGPGQIPVFAASPVPAAGATGVLRWYNDTGDILEIKAVRVSLSTAPASGLVRVDVKNSGGASVFGTGTKPATATTGYPTGVVSTISSPLIQVGSYVTVDVTANTTTGLVSTDELYIFITVAPQ